MKQITLGTSPLAVSNIALGCMRMSQLNHKEVVELIEIAKEQGINFFDHADIYSEGACEEIFANALKESSIRREDIILQSKCGIRKGFFDFSKEHILSSVDGILQRLQIDCLDILLLHRPDALVEPEEVAEAFSALEKSGKVKYFGVSNQTPMQIELLQKYVSSKLLVNQLQFGVMHTGMINHGIHMNMTDDASVNRDGEILEYCRLKDITIQAWSPYQYGFFEGVFLDNPKFPDLNKKIDELANKYNVTNTAIATAWILRHPANIQTIIGSMNKERIIETTKASDIYLTREEWYAIYQAAGNRLP